MEHIKTVIPWVIIIAVIAAIIIAVVVIKRRVTRAVRSFSNELLGTSDLIGGLTKANEEMSRTPRSVQSMTSVYLPQIIRDFPEFDYELYKTKAKSFLLSYFDAIENKDPALLKEEYLPAIQNVVKSVIGELDSLGESQVYDNIIIHDIQISRYNKSGDAATVVFGMSVEKYDYRLSGSNTVKGSSTNLRQSVYNVSLVFGQNAEKFGDGDALMMNCPNCGAPLSSAMSRVCEYCGSPVAEIKNTRAWCFDAVTEQSNSKRGY